MSDHSAVGSAVVVASSAVSDESHSSSAAMGTNIFSALWPSAAGVCTSPAGGVWLERAGEGVGDPGPASVAVTLIAGSSGGATASAGASADACAATFIGGASKSGPPRLFCCCTFFRLFGVRDMLFTDVVAANFTSGFEAVNTM